MKELSASRKRSFASITPAHDATTSSRSEVIGDVDDVGTAPETPVSDTGDTNPAVVSRTVHNSLHHVAPKVVNASTSLRKVTAATQLCEWLLQKRPDMMLFVGTGDKYKQSRSRMRRILQNASHYITKPETETVSRLLDAERNDVVRRAGIAAIADAAVKRLVEAIKAKESSRAIAINGKSLTISALDTRLTNLDGDLPHGCI